MFSVISGTNASALVWSSGFISSAIYTSKKLRLKTTCAPKMCDNTHFRSDSNILKCLQEYNRRKSAFPLCSIFVQLYPTFTHFSLHHKIVSSQIIWPWRLLSKYLQHSSNFLSDCTSKVSELGAKQGRQVLKFDYAQGSASEAITKQKKDKFISISIQLEYLWFCKMQSVIMSPPAVSL